MDYVQMLVVSLIVLIICLVFWFTSWNNYNNTKPVKNPVDDDDYKENQVYYDTNYAKTSNIAKVVGIIAAIGSAYSYYNMSPSDAACIWGGGKDDPEDEENYEGGLIVPIGTPIM